MRQRDKTPYALLGMLTLGPQSGYEIKKTLEASAAHFWSESYGQLYPVLRRLEAEGLASSRRQDKGGRLRKVFAITGAGREALGRWLQRPPEFQPPRNELLLKLFFGRHAPAGSGREHVLAYRAQQADLTRHYRELETRLLREHPRHPDLPYWRMTLRFGRRFAEAAIAWCDETLALLAREAAEKDNDNLGGSG